VHFHVVALDGVYPILTTTIKKKNDLELLGESGRYNELSAG